MKFKQIYLFILLVGLIIILLPSMQAIQLRNMNDIELQTNWQTISLGDEFENIADASESLNMLKYQFLNKNANKDIFNVMPTDELVSLCKMADQIHVTDLYLKIKHNGSVSQVYNVADKKMFSEYVHCTIFVGESAERKRYAINYRWLDPISDHEDYFIGFVQGHEYWEATDSESYKTKLTYYINKWKMKEIHRFIRLS